MFRILDLFLSSVQWRDTATLLGPLERANPVDGQPISVYLQFVC
jgi:hypothetical protein